MCRRSNKVAFTFIEIILVLMLLSAAAGIVVPDLFSRVHKNRLEDFSWKVGILMREAYHSAIFSGTMLWVYPDENAEIAVFDNFPRGKRIASVHFKPLSVPDWAEMKGFETGWCARADGFCDEKEITIRDIELGYSNTFALRPYDGEIIEKSYSYNQVDRER
ncbi:MAG: type II secretion system protein [Candidatus Riflebacteria bacterium]|nr:type II secretion system protein [Candidatus Riflebacteria bacterium]